jgi:TonB family protein
METKKPHDTRFITAIARLTACKFTRDTDLHVATAQYPAVSRVYHEEGKVLMQLVIDPDFCVRKATIVQSSGYYRLDRASLEFTMKLKFPPSMLRNVKSSDDGRPVLTFPMIWKIVPPPEPGDRCSALARCVDEAPPPPKVEVVGTPPEPGDIWMTGYYVHYAKTGYQWNDGQWEAPRPGYHWVAPHWEEFHSKWAFDPGQWEQDK